MTKIRVDQADVTLAELAEIEEALGQPLGQAFQSSQAKAIAAIAWIAKRREEPLFTLAEAMQLRMGDLDIVTPGTSPGEAHGGGNGASPPEWPEPGVSTPST